MPQLGRGEGVQEAPAAPRQESLSEGEVGSRQLLGGWVGSATAHPSASGCLCPAVTVPGERWTYWNGTGLVFPLILKGRLFLLLWVED